MANTLLHGSIFLAAALCVAGFTAPASASGVLDSGRALDRGIVTTLQDGVAGGLQAMAAWSGVPGTATGEPGVAEPPLLYAAADCSGAAAQAAAETGGQVLSVSSRQQGGQTVCVVTVLVPGQDGGRPRKQTITIPQ